MTDPLKISSLGKLNVLLGDEPLIDLARKVEAMLVYLACTRQPHDREALATLFWGEHTQAKALNSL